MHLPPTLFKVQIFKRNKIWQTVPGGFNSRAGAVSYGNKFYAEGEALDIAGPRPGQFRVVEGLNIPKRQEA